VPRKKWDIPKDAAQKEKLLADIRASFPTDESPADSSADILESDADDDLTFTVHYASAEPEENPPPEDHEEKVGIAPQALMPELRKNKKLLPFAVEQAIAETKHACENYLEYLAKHVIKPIFLMAKTKKITLDYAKNTLSADEIVEQCSTKNSVAFLLCEQNPRFGIAIMRYMSLKLLLDIIKDSPSAKQLDVFKKSFGDVKKYFNEKTHHQLDALANAQFLRAIDEEKPLAAHKQKSNLHRR
jgi:hypothetical protein